MTGNLITAGTQPSYTLTSTAAFDTLANGRSVTARIHASNAASPVTLNVNGLGAKNIRKFGLNGDIDLGIGDLQLGAVQRFVYAASANAGAGAWIIGDPAASVTPFPSGTALVFAQATAPTGWTKKTTDNDKALRVVSGSTGGTAGGTVAFTTAFASRTVSDVALTAAQMPSHTHTQQGSFTTGFVSADHAHNQQGGFNSGTESADHQHHFGASYIGSGIGSNGGYVNSTDNGGATTGFRLAAHVHGTTISGGTSGITVNHTHAVTISGGTTSAGSDQTHNHTLDMRVQYVDTIICKKD
jgi:hypothetical protein